MDPVGAFLIAALIATGVVRRWFGDGVDYLRGNGTPRHERLMQERQHAHEQRMARDQHRHTETMAGRRPPTAGQYIAAGIGKRLADGPLPYDQRHPLRRWWWRRCEDWAADDERRRREHADDHAKRNLRYQRWIDTARARARAYWENSDAGRARQRRRDGIVDAKVVDDPPHPPPPGPAGPGPDRPTPAPPAGGPPPGEPPAGTPPSAGSRPAPVWATAERTDQAAPARRGPLEIEPGWPGDHDAGNENIEPSDVGPAIDAPGDEGEEMAVSSALVATKRALARDARREARYHPAAATARKAVSTQLTQSVGEYNIWEVNDTVALAAAITVGTLDPIRDMLQDLYNQRVSGNGMRHLESAVSDLAEAVAELQRAKGGFEYQERAVEEMIALQQSAGVGNVQSQSAGQIH